MTKSKSITRDDVIKAIDMIDINGYPDKKSAKIYVLIFNGKKYPVKYTISLAKLISESKQITKETSVDTSWLNGGIQANSIVETLGFEVQKLSETTDELKKRKQEFLDWGNEKNNGKWSSLVPKANWLSGYWDFPEKNEPIEIIPIKNLLLRITDISEEEEKQLTELPENLFEIDNLKEFLLTKEIINKTIKNHSKEVNLIINSCNLLDAVKDKGWRGWQYSNFKRTNWYKEYEEYLTRSEKRVKTISESWNRILYGPPGTGKTYSINSIRDELIGDQTVPSTTNANLEKLSWREAIFLAYKQNNYKPMRIKDIEQKNIIKEFAKTKKSKTPYGTISTTIIENATENSTTTTYRRGTDLFQRNDKNNLNLWELTAEGKMEAEELEVSISQEKITQSEFFSSMVTFHQSYGYEDFIEGIYAETIDGQINYEVKDGVFKRFCDKASRFPNQNFLFVIDEINRGNISKIFGELITLIESSKRLGNVEEVKVKLPYSGSDFGIPKNISILGTMNTADRSIAMMDTALRRRFEFIEMMPDANVIRDEVGLIENIDIASILETMNQRIEYLYDREHTLGHAFFLGIGTLKELKLIFENKLIPLLQEYFFEDYQKIQAILGDVDGIFIKEISVNPNKIFNSKFSELINDYDNKRYVLNSNVTDSEFLKFIESFNLNGNNND
ncbi:AAA family ATPase [Vagococcus fluvialis]|uniref:McrB family protein n=1 Tax=Vagococcus fluvialis TaxID=2738 RepID=UPI003B594636